MIKSPIEMAVYKSKSLFPFYSFRCCEDLFICLLFRAIKYCNVTVPKKLDINCNQPKLDLPLSVRLKQPNLSPERESAPHCKTTALGWYISITFVITCFNIVWSFRNMIKTIFKTAMWSDVVRLYIPKSVTNPRTTCKYLWSRYLKTMCLLIVDLLSNFQNGH